MEEDIGVEERKGLLSGQQHDQEDTSPPPPRGWSRTRIIAIASSLIFLLTCGAIAQSLLLSPPPPQHPYLTFHGDALRSNGTHDFKRTVLLVSIDGLRADYLDRGLTPHLLDISKQGIRAKSMVPIFPTLTFPNHWALMTGLYAESHGIVANNFWDPKSQSEFHYNQVESCWNSSWWFGEPMWETAEKAGIKTANLMWPGPPKTSSGVESTYFVPWRDHVPLQEQLDQILQWIDLPLEERPQLIMAYEPSLDQAGHLTGPMSGLVNKTLSQIDKFTHNLLTALSHRNLTSSSLTSSSLSSSSSLSPSSQSHPHQSSSPSYSPDPIIDIIFLSDHGMTDTSHPTMIYMDDPSLLGPEGMQDIEHEDGWPAMGLRFREGVNVSMYLERLIAASEGNGGEGGGGGNGKDGGKEGGNGGGKEDGKEGGNGKEGGKAGFDVYTHSTMPERFHFARNEHGRIAPVYVVPRMGYALTTREQGDVGMSKGNHGYDNADPSMHAMFVAHGPFSAVTKALHQSRSLSSPSLSPPSSSSSSLSSRLSARFLSSLSAGFLPRPNKGWHSTSNDTYVMDSFPNVEIYNLVVRLLGIEGTGSGGKGGGKGGKGGKGAGNNGTEGFWDKYF